MRLNVRSGSRRAEHQPSADLRFLYIDDKGEIRGMYTEQELAAIAGRENNTKRNYLVVNRLQGKHIPVSPGKMLDMCEELAKLVKNAYPDERLLIVGFAETATAIGAALAVNLNTGYIQTTREKIDNVSWLYFTESHSHATEQKLVREDIESVIENTDRIVFAEDEVTTGNTILKIIDIIDREFGGRVKFSAASLLNGMDKQSYNNYIDRNIGIHYLVKTDHSRYGEIADGYTSDGEYITKNTAVPENPADEINITGALDARRYVSGDSYIKACDGLCQQIKSRIKLTGSRILVLGTEEFMFPAIYTAAQLEKIGYDVKTHSTTRSPISVCRASEYPLHRRYELSSLYDESRTTFIYDLEMYDTVLILTDSPKQSGKGVNSLVNALHVCDNKNIHLIRWIRE